MINIQRNFFIETILLETKLFKQKHIADLPYRDYITISNNDDLNLKIFVLYVLNACICFIVYVRFHNFNFYIFIYSLNYF